MEHKDRQKIVDELKTKLSDLVLRLDQLLPSSETFKSLFQEFEGQLSYYERVDERHQELTKLERIK